MTKKNLKPLVFAILLLAAIAGYLNSAAALISGFLFTLVFGHYGLEVKRKLINGLLKIAVVGLGFGMFLNEALQTGKEGLGLTVFTIFSTLILGFLFTRLFKLDPKMGYMVSSGTSICGGSAIAAVSSVIKASPKSISVALGVVFFLNAVALFIFPPIGHFFHLTQEQFGLWAAVAIHDTSSVVGAALDYGQRALQVATTVKLARALWIIPISFLSMLFFKSKEGKVKIPWFIFLFVLAILVNSYFNLPATLTAFLTRGAERLLVLTLLLIGSTLSIEDLKKTGIQPFLLGISLWLFISVSSLYLILHPG